MELKFVIINSSKLVRKFHFRELQTCKRSEVSIIVMSSEDDAKQSWLGLDQIAFACTFGVVLILIYTFGIIYLVATKDVCSAYSPLWVFGVVQLVLPFCLQICLPCCMPCFEWAKPDPKKVAAVKASNDFSAQVGAVLLGTIPFTILVVITVLYGGIVIYGGYVCSDMKLTGLWVWALVVFYLYVFLVVLYGVSYSLCIPAYLDFPFDPSTPLGSQDESTPLTEDKSSA